MRRPVGHEDTIRSLEERLPRFTLLLGPASTGKILVARWLAEQHTSSEADRQEFTPTVAGIEELRDYAHHAPLAGNGRGERVRVGILRDLMSADSTRRLLLLAEEPPEGFHLLVTSNSLALPHALLARGDVRRTTFLSDSEVEAVLLRRGLSALEASKAAAASRGTVQGALHYLSERGTRETVLLAVKALREGNLDALDAMVPVWKASHTEALRSWAKDAATGSSVTYLPREIDVPRSLALRILLALPDPAPRGALVLRFILPEISRGAL